MDRAPVRLWRMEKGKSNSKSNSKSKAKYRDLSTARWTVRLSSASVEMTFVEVG